MKNSNLTPMFYCCYVFYWIDRGNNNYKKLFNFFSKIY